MMLVPETGLDKPSLDPARLADALRARMRLLLVCLSNSWGGLEQVSVRDSLDLGAYGIDVSVLCLDGSPIHESLVNRKEVKALPLAFAPRNHFDFRMKQELDRLLSNGTNLIHAHQTSVLGSILPWLWKYPNVAAVASRHIMNSHNKRNFFHRALYSRLDALVVMSEALRSNILDTHPISEPRVKVIPLGLDFARFDPEMIDPQARRHEWGVDEETIVVGLVGRIDPAKGQGTFIKAAAGLMKNFADRKLKFVIVGEETLGAPSSHLEELRQMVSQFRLERHVIFAGFQDNIPEVMRAFDILVMPSRQEAFGLVAIEAMAMECPVVISRGGSAAEIVGEEEFGLLVAPDDAFDLQRQLRTLLANPSQRKEMGKKGRAHVLRYYDRTLRLQKTLELYERVLRRRGRP